MKASSRASSRRPVADSALVTVRLLSMRSRTRAWCPAPFRNRAEPRRGRARRTARAPAATAPLFTTPSPARALSITTRAPGFFPAGLPEHPGAKRPSRVRVIGSARLMLVALYRVLSRMHIRNLSCRVKQNRTCIDMYASWLCLADRPDPGATRPCQRGGANSMRARRGERRLSSRSPACATCP
jgi:hypothetical protein